MENKRLTSLLVVSLIIIGMITIIIIKNGQKNKEFYPNNYEKGFELLATEDFDKEEVLSRGYPSLLDIGGGECIPCKAMKPVLVELNDEWQGKVIVKFIDYWKYPDLGNQFNFSVIPTQFFYDKDGKLYKTHQGQITKEEVIDTFEEMGYSFNE